MPEDSGCKYDKQKNCKYNIQSLYLPSHRHNNMLDVTSINHTVS